LDTSFVYVCYIVIMKKGMKRSQTFFHGLEKLGENVDVRSSKHMRRDSDDCIITVELRSNDCSVFDGDFVFDLGDKSKSKKKFSKLERIEGGNEEETCDLVDAVRSVFGLECELVKLLLSN
jgi:hypothetical protein